MKKQIVSRYLKSVIYAALVLSFCCGPVNAADEKAKPAIELGAPFADNAILQRQMDVPVWGWSKPGTKITVEFASQKKTAKTAKDGKWMLKLDPLNASFDPQSMTITDNKGKKVVLDNILVGEVWMASGQSNMQWIVGKCDVGRVLLKQISDRVAAGKEKQPVIREAKVDHYCAAMHPIEHAEGAWSSDTGKFSAISYAFAYKLFSELQVPIGILNCSFSQTSILAWTPREGFASGEDEYTKAIYKKVLTSDPTTKEHKAAWDKFYQDIEDAIKDNKEISTKRPGNLNDNRDATWLFNARLNPMIPYAIRGAIWNQGYASQGDGLYYYNNLHSMIRGWRQLWKRPNLPVYFHQFYSAGMKVGQENNSPSVVNTAEMRMGTVMARDIPNANMASQIDITGAIHYYNKTLPGYRLAYNALKNQYGKDIVTDGPMFKLYKVRGSKIVVQFNHADGGLVVGETNTNSKNNLAIPTIIENGDDKVKLFYIADKNRVWYPASMKIKGEKVVLSSPKVKFPSGVSYASAGVGNQPNLYNLALLPASPFIYFDHKMVTKETWPHDPMKIDGVVPDPSMGGKVYDYRKMPVLSAQFRDNAVLQADQPVTIWGSAVHDWGYEADGKAEIKFSFGDVKKTIPVVSGMRQWKVTLPPMKATTEPRTLKASFFIDGELIHERIAENVIFGDVFYVAAPSVNLSVKGGKTDGSVVRMMKRKAGRSMHPVASRYSVCVSTTPKNRFASIWADAAGLPGAIGNRIAAKTGRPVGIIFMQGFNTVMDKGSRKAQRVPLDLKHWISTDYLSQAPSLGEDYKQLASVKPGTDYYNANAKRYVNDWKKLWGEYIPEMMETKAVPDGVAWGSYPLLASSVKTKAGQSYNVMTHAFGPGNYKGIIFLCSENMFEGSKAANYGSELSALANCWKDHFGGQNDTNFFYTIPSKTLSPKATAPKSIKGKSTAVEITSWTDSAAIEKLVDMAVK